MSQPQVNVSTPVAHTAGGAGAECPRGNPGISLAGQRDSNVVIEGEDAPARKVVCCPLSKCCRVVMCNKKAESPKLGGDDAWCPKEKEAAPGGGEVEAIEDIVSPSSRSADMDFKVGQKRPRDAVEGETAGADPGNGHIEGGSVTKCDTSLPELTKADFKRLADEVALIFVGTPCMPKVMCPLLFEAWSEQKGSAGTGSAEPDFATLLAVATTESNIKKVQKGTCIHGQIPFIIVIDSQKDAVYKLDLTGWNGQMLKACPRYRAARVCECQQFLEGCKNSTWPRAPRGKPRPENDIISTYPSLKWAVQCSFTQLVHDQALGLTVGKEQQILGNAFGVSWPANGKLEAASAPQAQTPTGRVIRPKDVLVLFWHQECPSCGPALQLLDGLMSDVVAKLRARISCLDTDEKALAWCPLSAVCVNVSDNDLGQDWIVDQTTTVPTLRLYPADCTFMQKDPCSKEGPGDCSSHQSPATTTPKPSSADGNITLDGDLKRLQDAAKAQARPFTTFKGVRSADNFFDFVEANCSSPDTQQMMSCRRAEEGLGHPPSCCTEAE